ncbi:RPA family protein [Halococcus sp. AFM35]|uniref:RPA family protein n=1 Tax=Halococcus sp. AFM35 TaxID=3421653 RepID=UPI003EC04925
MSASSDGAESTGREVAKRLFAREFNDATYTFKESEDELAPNYTLLPTGDRVNRLFFAGTLTETNDVGSDSEYWQGRVVDPTGTFYIYAGQYQPEAASTLRQIETPTYVTVVGKPRSYETDDGNTNVAVRPESITQVDEPTRDRWVVETADQTIDRLEAFDAETNDYAQMARDEYGERLSPYREAAIEALESLDATDASAALATSETTSDAAESDSSAGDTEQVAADADTHASGGSEESVGSTESVESEESSSDELSGSEESSEDTGLGEYE